MIQREMNTENWYMRHVNPDRGVPYGQLREKVGKTVRAAYASANTPMQPRVAYARVA